MKHFLSSSWGRLFVWLLLLATLGACYARMAQFLPVRPYVVVQLDYYPRGLSFSPDGKLVVTSKAGESAYQLCQVDVWDVDSGTHRGSFGKGWENFYGVEFSPDSKLLVTRESGPEFKIWERATGELRVAREQGDSRSTSSGNHFTPDGLYLLLHEIGGDGPDGIVPDHVVVWELETQRERMRIAGTVWLIQFAPGGKRFTIRDRILFGTTKSVRVWETQEGKEPARLLFERNFAADNLAISPDLSTIATVNVISHSPGISRIRLWDTATGQETGKSRKICADRPIQSLQFSRNGRYLVANCGVGAYPDSTSSHFILDRGAELETVTTAPLLLHISPCERWFLSWDNTGVEVWETNGRREHADLHHPTDRTFLRYKANGDLSYPVNFEFSPDGRFLAVTGYDTTAQFPLTKALVTGQWNKINTTETYAVGRLWDVERSEEIATYRDCEQAFFSPDGRTLATVHTDSSIRFYTVPPPFPLGPVLALTTATWGLALLVALRVKRRFRRWRRSTSGEAQSAIPPPKGGGA